MLMWAWAGLAGLAAAGGSYGVGHGRKYEPEYVLVATAQNISINCETRLSVVFNGTFPGPAIHMHEGKTTWVRVYNHMKDENVTVVSWTTRQPASLGERK
jgi:FtsP/CotA-like multicopper oxidase with cupredoxin domain